MRLIICLAIVLCLSSPVLAQLPPPDPVGNPVPSDKDIASAALGEAIGYANFTLDALTPRSDQSKVLRKRFDYVAKHWPNVPKEKRDALNATDPTKVGASFWIQGIIPIEDGTPLGGDMPALRAKADAASKLIQTATQQIVDGKYADALATATAAKYAWIVVHDDLVELAERLDVVQYWMDAMQAVIDDK